MSSPCLFGPNGQPISSKFIKASENGNRRLPPENIRAQDPLKKLVTRRDWQTVSFLADKIDANFGISEGIITQKNMFAVTGGWLPEFRGGDEDDPRVQEWAEIATTWLIEQWYAYCDVRGPNFDFVTGLYMDGVSIDARGDAITMLTRSEGGEGNWPLLQRIPNRQIGQWDDTPTVKGGEYDGEQIENGVIKNRFGHPLAYRHLGENRGDFTDIPASNIIHTFEPRWIDQSRGFPLFLACLDEFRSMSLSQDWEMQSMLIASAISLIEYLDDGEAKDGTGTDDPLNVNGLPTNTGDPELKTFWSGLIRYYRANSGGKLEQLVTHKPGADWESFNDRLVQVCCAAANWPVPLVWKRGSANGTATRAEQNIARRSIADRQSLLMYPAVREIGYAVSVAMQPASDGGLGAIPPYPGKDRGGFLKWGFSMPPLMTIDEGHDRDNDREDAKYGWVTDEDKARRMGTTARKLARTRDREVQSLIKRAQKISKETGVPEAVVREMLRQSNPNGAAGTTSSDPATDPNAAPGGASDDSEALKAEMDTYGVAVRAGAITPSDEDEAMFRARMNLPAMNSNIKSAWKNDKGVRRPITLVQPGGKPTDTLPKEDDQ